MHNALTYTTKADLLVYYNNVCVCATHNPRRSRITCDASILLTLTIHRHMHHNEEVT